MAYRLSATTTAKTSTEGALPLIGGNKGLISVAPIGRTLPQKTNSIRPGSHRHYALPPLWGERLDANYANIAERIHERTHTGPVIHVAQ